MNHAGHLSRGNWSKNIPSPSGRFSKNYIPEPDEKSLTDFILKSKVLNDSILNKRALTVQRTKLRVFHILKAWITQ